VTSKRIFIIGISVAIALSALYLLFWWVGWRVAATLSPGGDLFVMPVTAACGLLLGLSLALIPLGAGSVAKVRLLSVLVGALASFILMQYALGLQSGIERYFFGEEARALFDEPMAGRPAILTSLSVLFLSFGVWFSTQPQRLSFDVADVCASAALFVSLTAMVAHLYLAQVDGPATDTMVTGVTPPEAVLIFALSLAVLALNPHGLIATLDADDAGAAARRRLIPAAVLTPILFGFLLVLTQKLELIAFYTALALMVTLSIVVFVILIERVGVLLSHIQAEQKGEIEERESKALEVGMTDALTGLLNRRGWEQNLKVTEAKCQAEGINSCVIVIDLDGLKRINDTLGHQQGDALIKRAANALKTASRREDVLARLGGDEFAYVSVGCQPEHASAVLRRLAQGLENSKVQASLGFAMRDLAGSLQAAFHEADQAMYIHKRERKARMAPSPA
jgi:diguanylate cyclase (GGDEF)-like protein